MAGTYFHKGAMHGINLARAMTEPQCFIYDGDFFSQFDNDTNESEGGYIISGAGTETAVLTSMVPRQVLTVGTGQTDNNSFFMTRQSAVGAFDITIGSGRKVAYETRLRINEGSEIAIFAGLCQAATVTEDTLVADNTGILGNFDTIGIHCLMHATDVDVDGVSRILGGATQTGADTMTEDADAVFHIYGFQFDGNKTITWFVDNAVFSTQTIVAATFPTGEALVPTWTVKTGDATGDATAVRSIKIDYWQCVELLLSEDALAD